MPRETKYAPRNHVIIIDDCRRALEKMPEAERIAVFRNAAILAETLPGIGAERSLVILAAVGRILGE